MKWGLQLQMDHISSKEITFLQINFSNVAIELVYRIKSPVTKIHQWLYIMTRVQHVLRNPPLKNIMQLSSLYGIYDSSHLYQDFHQNLKRYVYDILLK